MYITSIKIENLRCFAQTELTFQHPGRETETPLRFPNINLLLGNNGAGKTTVLKAIALAALAPVIQMSGFVPYHLIRRIGNRSDVPVKAILGANLLLQKQDVEANPLLQKQDVEPFNIESGVNCGTGMQLERKGDYEVFGDITASKYYPIISLFTLAETKMYGSKSPALLVVGYGASRRPEDAERLDLTARRKARLPSYERVAGLFENHISLIPLASWLPNFRKENPGRHKQVVNLINRLLPEGSSFDGEFEQGEYWFEINGTKAPFGALSDGYRAYIGWIADLLYHICMGAPKGAKLVETRGIVLVDEIDLHLHPEWQRSVIETISKTLPNLQFVFTTHSPIVAGSVEKENLYVMETTADGASVVRQYNEEIHGLNADEILLSSYFNLPTTRSTTFQNELKTLSVQAGQGDLKAALAFMKKLAAPTANGTSQTHEIKAAKPKTTKKQTTKKQATAKTKKNK